MRQSFAWAGGVVACGCAAYVGLADSPASVASISEQTAMTDTTRGAIVSDFVDMCRRRGVSRLVVQQNGKVLAKVDFHPDSPALLDLMSVTKSIVSLVVGKVMDEYGIPLSARLSDVAGIAPGPVGELTLQDILDQRSCLRLGSNDEVGAVYRSPDCIRLAAQGHLECVPGSQWRYSNVAVNLLSAFVETQSRVTLHAYAMSALFAPLGIEDSFWESDAAGHSFAMAGLRLRAEDLAKVANLILTDGMWKSTQILPFAWVREIGAWGRREPFEHNKLWWHGSLSDPLPPGPEDTFPLLNANGYGGQYLFVSRQSQLIVVILRDMDRQSFAAELEPRDVFTFVERLQSRSNELQDLGACGAERSW